MEIESKGLTADFHTYTTSYKLGFSTLKENIDIAKEMHIKYIGLIEHIHKGNISDIDTILQRLNIFKENTNYFGVQVLNGYTYNMLHRLDVSKLSSVKLKVGLIEDDTVLRHQDLSQLKLSIKDCIDRGNVNVIIHPEKYIDKLANGKYGIEVTQDIREYYEWLIWYCKSKKVFLGVSEKAFTQESILSGDDKRLEYWLNAAKENNNPIMLSSEAIISSEVGKFNNSLAVLKKIRYSKDMILNYNEELIKIIYNI